MSTFTARANHQGSNYSGIQRGLRRHKLRKAHAGMGNEEILPGTDPVSAPRITLERSGSFLCGTLGIAAIDHFYRLALGTPAQVSLSFSTPKGFAGMEMNRIHEDRPGAPTPTDIVVRCSTLTEALRTLETPLEAGEYSVWIFAFGPEIPGPVDYFLELNHAIETDSDTLAFQHRRTGARRRGRPRSSRHPVRNRHRSTIG